MKYYTKCNDKLLQQLENETNVLWNGNQLPTKVYPDSSYVIFDIFLNNTLTNWLEDDALELTNDSFVKYVKSVVGERNKL